MDLLAAGDTGSLGAQVCWRDGQGNRRSKCKVISAPTGTCRRGAPGSGGGAGMASGEEDVEAKT